ncbi:MAG: 2Fe-2S iron-sulfur cluster-binding protein [Chitinophagaceae bacterium]
MDEEKNTILFTVIYQETEYPVQTRRNQYYSLMTLISDRLALPGFGLCCGMGSCGTCMVEIRDSFSNRKRFELSCDIQINDDLANTTIIVEGF